MSDPLQPTPPNSGMSEPAVPPPVPLVPTDVSTSPTIPPSGDAQIPSLPPTSAVPSEQPFSGLAQAAKEVVSVESPPESTVIPPASVPPSGDMENEKPKKKGVSVGIIALLLFFGLSIGGSVFYLTNKNVVMHYMSMAGVMSSYPTTPPTLTCSSTIVSQFIERENCGGGQVCSASPCTGTVVVDRYGPIKLKYTTNDSHCSDVKLDVYVNDEMKVQTGWIVPQGSTEYLDLGTVDPGSYGVKIIATGRSGGCNAGDLGGWGGTLYFQCPIVATPTPLATGTPTPIEVVTSTPTQSPTPTNTGTPTPTTPPSAPGICDASCDNDSGCSSGFVCASVGGIKRCRKSECPSQYNCICPTGTVTPTPTTSSVVVVTATPTPASQTVVITATPSPIVIVSTPKIPVSGTGSVLGVSTVAGGLLLLLLGLLL